MRLGLSPQAFIPKVLNSCKSLPLLCGLTHCTRPLSFLDVSERRWPFKWTSWCWDPQSPKLKTTRCFAVVFRSLVWCSDWWSGTSTPWDTEPCITTVRFNESTVACGVQANSLIFSICLNTFSRCHQEPRKNILEASGLQNELLQWKYTRRHFCVTVRFGDFDLLDCLTTKPWNKVNTTFIPVGWSTFDTSWLYMKVYNLRNAGTTEVTWHI